MSHVLIRPCAAALLALACAACSDKAGLPAAAAPLVTVANPTLTPVADKIELDGVVAPSAVVNLVARVPGYLQAAPFTEGQPVKQGQLLFVIEPEPYREQVKLSQAKLDQARAEAQRQEGLMRENATSQSSVENARSQMQQAEVNVRLAQINLDYTQVRASFDGVVGRRLIDVGNYVGATPGGTVLGTLQKLHPAYIGFTVGERDLLRLRAHMPADVQRAKLEMAGIKVQATLQGEIKSSATGILDFIDSGLNAGTGTMQLRAKFANEDMHLIPGLYAKVVLGGGHPRQALLIPNVAILNDQQGSYVFVVGEGERATRRNILPGDQFGRQREVSKGLNAGDRVVVDGISNVGEGRKVAVKAAAAPAAN